MSLEISVLLNKDNVPTRAQWQTWIHEAGFKLTLDPTFDPLSDTGFIPCKMESTDTGFEFYFTPSVDLYASYPHLQAAGQYDSAFSFIWGGRLDECAAATICSASLANAISGVMYEPQEDLVLKNVEALSYAQKLLAEISPHF